jgi:hypothetical protein
MGVVYEAEDTKLAVASGSSAFRVRVWQITSWRRGPRGGRPPPEGASVAYALVKKNAAAFTASAKEGIS